MKIAEIAKKAGVSIGTVDRVLHHRGRVSQENIDKIMQIVRDSGYEPNQYARSLRQNKDYVIGVMIPSLGSEFGYWASVEEGILKAQHELRSMRVRFMFSFFQRNEASSVAVAMNALLENNVDALIIAPLMGDVVQQALVPLQIPYVFIDSSFPDLQPFADFAQDPLAAGAVGARLLSLLKPEARIFVTLQQYQAAFNGTMRAKGFEAWMKTHRPGVDVVLSGFDSHEELSLHMKKLVADCHKPDGIFVVNDSAHVVATALMESGLKDQIAVVGFDMVEGNRQALAGGSLDAVISQRPSEQAYLAAMALYRFLVLGQKDEGQLKTPIDIYLKENVVD